VNRLSPVLVAVAATASLGIGQAQDTFRSATDLVVVQAVVFSEDGRAVTDLSAADFRLLEDGEVRPLPVVIPPSPGPLEVALAIDASGSMSLWPVQEAVHMLLDALDPASCVVLLPFNREVQSTVRGHPGDPALRQAIDALEFKGEEAIYDALVAAFGLLRSGMPVGGASMAGATPLGYRMPVDGAAPTVVSPVGTCRLPEPTGSDTENRPRRAVVAITDGQDHESALRPEDALMAAWGSKIPIYTLVVLEAPLYGPSGLVRRMRLEPVRALEDLATHTGGGVIRVRMERRRDLRPFWAGLRRLGASLSGHYVLGYTPRREGLARPIVERREIEIRVSRAGYEVFTPQEVVLGKARSDAAAAEAAARGFFLLENAPPEKALLEFDKAVAMGPDLGVGHYGRALALAGLGDHAEALVALVTAAELAEAAWRHALRAHWDGAPLVDLIAQLQLRSPRDLSALQPPSAPAIRVFATGRLGAMASVVIPPVLSALVAAIENSAELTLATTATRRPMTLEFDVTKVETHGAGATIEGWLVLRGVRGEILRPVKVRVRDTGSVDEVLHLASDYVARVEAAVSGRER